MKDKLAQFTSLQERFEKGEDLQMTMQLREEICEQHRALGQIKAMAAKYGCDISGQQQLHKKQSSGLTSAT